LWEAVVKTPLLPLPSTAATIYNAAINAVGSIPLPPPLTTTAITAVDNPHCRCHTVNNNDRQKPADVVCHQRQQWQLLLMEAAVHGGCSDGGLC
jgi:hypothetical protein